LRERPNQSIVLVGHTDSRGSLESNIKLSKERAISVQALLNTQFPDIEPGRINADGIGYLAPVASNQTITGRELNRRVEVILIPVE
jgi:OOP family OmpA-OmpF porin